ncbi:MAG: hypothetical protein ACE5D0_09160 [Fidelibacterota bacterium]
MTSIARITQGIINEYDFKEDAIPRTFMAMNSKDKMNQISEQIVCKVNASYRLHFPAINPKSNKDTILRERFWKYSAQGESFFMELTRKKHVQGQQAGFVTEYGHEWRDFIYTRCIELKNEYNRDYLFIETTRGNPLLMGFLIR